MILYCNTPSGTSVITSYNHIYSKFYCTWGSSWGKFTSTEELNHLRLVELLCQIRNQLNNNFRLQVRFDENFIFCNTDSNIQVTIKVCTWHCRTVCMSYATFGNDHCFKIGLAANEITLEFAMQLKNSVKGVSRHILVICRQYFRIRRIGESCWGAQMSAKIDRLCEDFNKSAALLM